MTVRGRGALKNEQCRDTGNIEYKTQYKDKKNHNIDKKKDGQNEPHKRMCVSDGWHYTYMS
jgi:hypothetical protein